MKKIILALFLLFTPIFFNPTQSYATVSSASNKIIYSGDNVSTTFSFPYNIYAATDLIVYEQNTSTKVITTLSLNIHYSVALTAISGTTGAYTAVVNLAGGASPVGALQSGTNLIILREIPYTQLINISDYSATPAATWNRGFDRGTILSQQLLEQVNRSVIQPVSATSQITLPSPSADLLLCWNSAATAITNCAVTATGSLGVPIANSNLQALTTANLVSCASFYNLSSITSLAGVIPIANIPSIPNTSLSGIGTGASNLLQLNASAKIPAVDGSFVTNLNASAIGIGTVPSANLPSFGTEVTGKTVDTIYQAGSSGGFVTIQASYSGSGAGYFQLKTDAANPPTTVKTEWQGNGVDGSIFCYVKANEYYKMEASKYTVSFYGYIPLH